MCTLRESAGTIRGDDSHIVLDCVDIVDFVDVLSSIAGNGSFLLFACFLYIFLPCRHCFCIHLRPPVATNNVTLLTDSD